jgi:uncharacterized protein (TIGR02145 family)
LFQNGLLSSNLKKRKTMKKIYLLLPVLFFSHFLFSQTVITENDTFTAEDTIRFIVPEHRGDVQWQFSDDSLSWIGIPNEIKDTFLLSPVETSGYFRAVITEGTCAPVYSSIARIKYSVPLISTLSADDITLNSATLRGEISDNGGSEVTARGFYWSQTNEVPNETDNVEVVGSGTGIFTQSITGLESNTTYYFRAFAENKKGTALGNVVSFTTSVNMPEVVTLEVFNIETNSATFKGSISYESGENITSRGFYWSETDYTPDDNDNTGRSGTGTGTYFYTTTNLKPNTTYYVAAFAISNQGTTTGNVVEFTTDEEQVAETSTIDYEGITYKTVKIGEQWWMAENLAYLPSVSPASEGSNTTPYYYVYDYNGTSVSAAKSTDKYETYGVLYNWEAAKTACPPGWHLPTYDDWEQLASFISDDNGGYSKDGDGTWSSLGKHLKAEDGWATSFGTSGGNGIDDYEFTALPGGYRGLNRDNEPGSMGFHDYFGLGGWWSATQRDSNNAWGRILIGQTNDMYRPYRDKSSGASVRCVKD